VLSQSFGGFLADYYSIRKKFILVGWFSSTLVLLVPILHLEISTMLLATILGTALWSIGAPALVAEVMRRRSPGFRFGIWWSLADVMYLLGSLSAGFLYKVLGLRIVLLLCLLWYLVNGFVIAVSYRTEVEVPRSRPSSLITELLEDMRTSFLRKECALLNTCTLIAWFSIWSIEGLARAKVLDVVGSEVFYSYLTALAVLTELVLAPVIERMIDRYSPWVGVTLGILLHIVSGVLIALSRNIYVIAVAWVIPFGYILSCSLYVMYSKFMKYLADAVGTCKTFMYVVAVPATFAASIADYIGRDYAVLSLTLVAALSCVPLYLLKRIGETREIT